MSIISAIIRTALLTASIIGSCTALARQPNVIFILADDLGYGDLGVTGHPYAMSPNLDKLANQGIQIAQAYTSGGWCSPSRYGLMSGVFPAREFLVTHVIPSNKPSVTSVLKDAGYKTAHFGKWHMGDAKVNAPPPSAYGIDESLTTQSTGPTWPASARKDPHYREKTTPHYINLAIDFIKRNKDAPFYINLWLYPTHSYINPTPEQLVVYEDLKVDINDFENPLQREFLEFVSEHGDVQDAMRAYCADVTALDTEIGRLMKVLAELSLEEETIVIFSSDNGPGPLCNNWDAIIKRYKERPTLLNNVGSAGPFRDRKVSLHDGGVRAPLFIHWPGTIKAGQVDEKTVFCGVDFLPTIAALTGASIPEAHLDGQDLSKAFLGSPVQRDRIIYWSDKPWWVSLRDKQWKAHIRRDEFLLFDLSNDPSESNNLASKFPEKAKQYQKLLKDWSKVIHKPQ
jgi:N-acetylgalactosamine-6-sulfatase